MHKKIKIYIEKLCVCKPQMKGVIPWKTRARKRVWERRLKIVAI